MENERARAAADAHFQLRSKNRKLSIYTSILLVRTGRGHGAWFVSSGSLLLAQFLLCVSVCYLLWLHGELHRMTMKDLMREELRTTKPVAAADAASGSVALARPPVDAPHDGLVDDSGDEMLDEAYEELVRLLQLDGALGWRAVFVLRADYFIFLRPPPYEPLWWVGWIGTPHNQKQPLEISVF